MTGLGENSHIYHKRSDIYEALAAAEDADGLVFNVLRSFVTGKRVLDIGCGTGKYLRLLAPYAKGMVGVDAAASQLAVARKATANMDNVELVHGDAAEVDMPTEQFDVAIACWALGTILDDGKRLAVLERMRRLVRTGGLILLVENDSHGEFEEIRRRTGVSQVYNRWLEKQAGFASVIRLSTKFRFATASEAAGVFGAIWGDEVGRRVVGPEIAHEVVVFRSRVSDR